ncbi:MAG: oligosaccharide flippase family protein [Acidobacteria bacterium]|nr:oligosaccharide flippase family protein [Acidobacteriota bacterium]
MSPAHSMRQRASTTAVRGAKTVAGDLAAVASGRVALVLLAAVSVVITTRLLGPRGYAVLALVGVVAKLAWNAGTSWTGISARRYGREDLELRGKMNRITWNRGLIAAPLVLASFLLMLGLKAAGVVPLGLTWNLVAIALATSLMLMLTDHLTTMLEAAGRMRLSAGVQVLGQAAYVGALVVVFVSLRHFSAPSVLLLNLAIGACVTIALTRLAWRTSIVPLEFDRKLLRRMLKLSIPMIGFTVSQYVFSAVDIVILKIFRGQADVGIYAVAYQAFSTLSQVAQALTIVLVPLFVSLKLAGREDVVRRYMERSVRQGGFLFAVIAGLAIPFIPLAVPLVFSSAFAGAVVPMAVLMCGLTFFFANSLVAPVLTLHEQSRALAIVWTGGAVLNVIGDIVFVAILHMGILAPAIATSGALMCMFAGYYLAAQRPLGVRIPLPLLQVIPLAAGLLPTLVWGGITGTIAGVLAVVGASTALIMWKRPFSREDTDVIATLRLPESVKRFAIGVINFID